MIYLIYFYYGLMSFFVQFFTPVMLVFHLNFQLDAYANF